MEIQGEYKTFSFAPKLYINRLSDKNILNSHVQFNSSEEKFCIDLRTISANDCDETISEQSCKKS